MNAIVERGSNGMGARAATTCGASRLLEDPRDRREFRRESRRSYSRFSRSTLAMRWALPSIHLFMRASHSSRGPPYFCLASTARCWPRLTGRGWFLEFGREEPGREPGRDEPGLEEGREPGVPGRSGGSGGRRLTK
jgi:hypothetical protein